MLSNCISTKIDWLKIYELKITKTKSSFIKNDLNYIIVIEAKKKMYFM